MKRIVFLITVLLVATMTQAQEKTEKTTPSSPAVSNIRLAHELAKYGYQTYSASALIEAAQILSNIETQSLDDATYEQGQGTATDKTSEALSVAKLLSDAKEFANGDELLLSMLSRVKVEKKQTRGALGGPKRASSVVYANSTDRYVVAFKYGLPAEIFVSGDGDTDLDLYVYDENGNLIGKDDDYTDDCYVSWTPAWTGKFIIKIKNCGLVSNAYVIVTN